MTDRGDFPEQNTAYDDVLGVNLDRRDDDFDRYLKRRDDRDRKPTRERRRDSLQREADEEETKRKVAKENANKENGEKNDAEADAKKSEKKKKKSPAAEDDDDDEDMALPDFEESPPRSPVRSANGDAKSSPKKYAFGIPIVSLLVCARRWVLCSQ